MQLNRFLRTVLMIDAASCLGMAAIVLPTAQAASGPLGVDAGLLTFASAALVPIGLYMLWLFSRREAAPLLVWLVILGNLGWTAASFATAASLPGITGLGALLVGGQGAAVLALAIAEWIGLRSSQQAGPVPA